MTDKELFSQKASDGYLVCLSDTCPIHEACLRWKVSRCVPPTLMQCKCVNPHYPEVGTEACPMRRPGEKVQMARGMMHVFNDDMPKRLEQAVRSALIGSWGRTYYFEYRNGTRLITPAMQKQVRQLFRKLGWEEEIQFDDYVEEYDW